MDTTMITENMANTSLISFFALLIVFVLVCGLITKQIKYEKMTFFCPKCGVKRYSYAAFKQHEQECKIHI